MLLNAFLVVLSFIVAISILIAFHEWGHLLAARSVGVKVLRFSLGFGKILCSRTSKQDTEYAISLIPIGGYVKMLDEREGFVAENERHMAFNRQSLAKRSWIVVAGPLFNLIFAIIAFWGMLMIGIESPAPIIDSVKAGSIAQSYPIASMDEIIRVNDKPTYSWRAVNIAILSHLGSASPLRIELKTQANETKVIRLKLSRDAFASDTMNFVDTMGITPYHPDIKPVINLIVPDSAAERAGMQSGDIIKGVNGEPVSRWKDFAKIIKDNANQSIEFRVLRDDELVNITVVPEATDVNGKVVGVLGIQSEPLDWPKSLLRHERDSAGRALIGSLYKTWEMTSLTFSVLKKLIFGQISTGTLSGPIGIAQAAKTSASYGPAYFLNFLGLISISLAVLNILPIPLLDGGHLLYYAIEAIRGQPLSVKAQHFGLRIGIVLLLGIMTIAFYNDISRLY